ncbi:MAG: ATP-binding protein [Polyangiales bacterium]
MSDRPSNRESSPPPPETWEPHGSGEIAVPRGIGGKRSSAPPSRDSGEVLVPAQEVAARRTVIAVRKLVAAAAAAESTDALEASARALAAEDPSGVTFELIATLLPSLAESVRLRGELEHFRRSSALLVSRASVPIAVMDASARLEVTSQPLARALGHEERPRVHLVDLVDEADRPALEHALARARGGDVPSVTCVVHVENGARTLVLELAAMRDRNGTVTNLVALGHDVSEVTRLEQQVRHSDRLATVGRIAAGVVHELNNPLSSIFVYSESLLRQETREGAPEDKLQKLRRIVDNAERIQRLTQDLTTYSRPNVGTPEVFPVESIVDQALGFCEHVLRDAEATVERAFADEPSPVFGMRTQLQQVFINLITNACHAMAGGEARLRVETRRDDRGRVVVRVVDSGPGVPPEIREAVFEPFVTTKGEGKGTGLGLSIVRKLVEQHGGSVGVEDGERTGATFVVTLPIHVGESSGRTAG